MVPVPLILTPELGMGEFPYSESNSRLAPENRIGLPTPSPSAVSEDSPEEDQTPTQFRRPTSHIIPSEPPHDHETDSPQDSSQSRIRTWGDDWESTRFPRLSKPVEVMRHSYDVVVIGSGYGGGVAASRMSRAGKHVCLLERGQERWPGEYPASACEALKQMHVSGDFAPKNLPKLPVDGGDPTGMYHLVLGRGQNAVVGNGLGGTSLINANVFLEADKDSLAMKMWPEELRNNPDELDRYYRRAADVLQPEAYPQDWPKLPKLDLLEKQAQALGMGGKFKRAPQTTRFRNGPNSMGVEMKPSSLTGQDCTGVNDGSKNTTLVTYVADAWNWGAEMFCECEVRYIEKAVGREGWIVYYAWHGQNRAHFKANLHGDLMWVHAKEAVFMGAGAIGTTEILLRSKDMGLEMSSEVGRNMSGNGDILAFGYNTDHQVNSMGRPCPSPYNPVGPCITGVIDNRHGHKNPLDGYVIEEGTIPSVLAPFLQLVMDLLPGSVEPKGENIYQRTQAAFQRYGSRFLGPYFKDGAMEKTQTYLIMSHDSNQAVLTLKDDKPSLEFLGVGRSHHVKELNYILEKATNAVGGTLVQNPFSALFGQQVTVHPIGGASMARDGTGATGVTNDRGEVFVGAGHETHDGLIVADGGLVPTALGANPLATITALAERVVEKYCDKKGLNINWSRNGILDLFGEPKRAPDWNMQLSARAASPSAQVSEEQRRLDQIEAERFKAEDQNIDNVTSLMEKADRGQKAGFGFTEVMSGFLHRDNGMVRDQKRLYELAYRTAKNGCESARFFLSVQTFDTNAMVREPDHEALLTGTFVCPTISGSPFMVHRGQFNLFLINSKAPGTRNLTYDFDMTGIDGKMVHFHGYKVVDSSVALAPVAFWKATSTLYVTITSISGEYQSTDGGDGEEAPVEERRQQDHDRWCSCGEAWRHEEVLAKGIMHIAPTDFASEILTMTPTGSTILKKIWSATSFLTYFTRKSMSLFLTPFTHLQYPKTITTGFINNTHMSESYAIVAEDGVATRMHMWKPTYQPMDGDGNPVPVKNLFLIPGAAVDHQIYALPTIPYNAINYFCRAGYRCFVSVHRIGQLMVARNQHTTFDARLDLKAHIEYIREHFGSEKIYTIAHCMGSVAFSAGLLDGTIPADWILGVSCSQVFMNPIWNTSNMLKAKLGPIPADTLYKKLAGDWFSCSSSPDDTFVQRALNQALRIWPDERAELCNNVSCHRCSLVFGRCWNHRNLNEATHRQIDRFFGGVNVTLLHLLMKQGSEGHVMTNEPDTRNLDTVDNIRRLGGIPFLLFVGGDNAVLSPESTQRTYEILCDVLGRSTEGQDGLLQYRRRVVPGYGHLDCWMGRNAWKDVYPFVRREVDRVVRGKDYVFVEPNDEFKKMVENGSLLH